MYGGVDMHGARPLVAPKAAAAAAPPVDEGLIKPSDYEAAPGDEGYYFEQFVCDDDEEGM
jgi:hypothetical protein